MLVVCLDFEGVLIPEIWPHIAKRTGVAALNLTTRDVKDYRELMEKRVAICKENHITLKDIQEYISELPLMEGALEFCNWIREKYQLIILSDTFYSFVPHFIAQLNNPTLFCHTIEYQESLGSLVFHLRQDNQKQKAVEALRSLNFSVFASGDSYNDTTMLGAANCACLFRAPVQVIKEFSQYPHCTQYQELKNHIESFAQSL